MSVIEMRMLIWISENKWNDRIWDEEIHLKIGVVPTDEKMRESRLRWFGHVQRRAINAPVRKIELIQVEGIRHQKKKKKLRELKKGRGRPKLTLMEQIKKDSSIKEVTDNMNLDRNIMEENNTFGRP